MLQTLKIKNVALIDAVTLNFNELLNVISGETGAGKSIILDALSFVFGGRADKSLIRSGCNSMKVEAIFTSLSQDQIDYIFQETNISADVEMFLSREIDLSGRNTCKINGELVSVASVKKICSRLVDIHGQSEHLAILNNDYQLQIIDLFSKESNAYLLELNKKIEELKIIEKQIKELGGSEQEKQNLIDLYTYQIQEIEDANIKPDELDKLLAEKKQMQAFEKINQALTSSYQVLSKNPYGDSAIEQICQALKLMDSLSEINPHFKEISARLNAVNIELEDLIDTINLDARNNVFDQAKFEFVDNRIDYIKTLFRKYGGDYVKLNEYYNKIKLSLTNLINGAERYKELALSQQNILEQIDAIQDNLSRVRKSSAKKLVANLLQELHSLGMPNAMLDIAYYKISERYSTNGYDRVEYMFSSNKGFELKPLNKVVSGGEMSRVMLAYKIVVSQVDSIHTILFDEVDTGLSGNIATVVAQYMARLSLSKQIIAISHLPQICAMADYNIKVEKYADNVTTHTCAKVLLGQDLFNEIARLMGANDIHNGASIGEELKINSDKYKHDLRINL